MQFTCCTKIMIFELYISRTELSMSAWESGIYFRILISEVKCMIYFMGIPDFLYFLVFFWLFMIMLSLMNFCFTCMSIHVQFSSRQFIIIMSSHMFHNHALHCSGMSMAISQALCCWYMFWFRGVLLGSVVSTCPSGGNLVYGSPPAASCIWGKQLEESMFRCQKPKETRWL